MFGLIKRRGNYEVIDSESPEAMKETAKTERFEVLLMSDNREKLEAKQRALSASKAQVEALRTR